MDRFWRVLRRAFAEGAGELGAAALLLFLAFGLPWAMFQAASRLGWFAALLVLVGISGLTIVATFRLSELQDSIFGDDQQAEEAVAALKDTQVDALAFDRRGRAAVRITVRGFPPWLKVGGAGTVKGPVRTQDPAFDGAVACSGPESPILACLSEPVRAELHLLVEAFELSIDEGAGRLTLPAGSHPRYVLSMHARAEALARELTVSPEAEEGVLLQAARTDPAPGVRRRALGVLLDRENRSAEVTTLAQQVLEGEDLLAARIAAGSLGLAERSAELDRLIQDAEGGLTLREADGDLSLHRAEGELALADEPADPRRPRRRDKT